MQSLHMYTIAVYKVFCIGAFTSCLLFILWYNVHSLQHLLSKCAVNCLPTFCLQEAVLGLKTPSPITVLLERGEGFFRQLWVESFPHFGKKQIKRRKTGASNIQTDASRRRRTGRQSTWPTHWAIKFPFSHIYLVGSTKMLAMAYRLN